MQPAASDIVVEGKRGLVSACQTCAAVAQIVRPAAMIRLTGRYYRHAVAVACKGKQQHFMIYSLDTPGATTVGKLKPAIIIPTDSMHDNATMVCKCAFASTNLDFILRQNNIQNLVLAGFLVGDEVSVL